MVEDWLETVRDQVLEGPGSNSTLVLAVSGGADSIAMLHGFAALRESLQLRLVVAHLDHGLRPDSAEDAAFVGRLSLSLGIQCLRERQEIAAVAAAEGRNLEDAARRARYEMLEQAARAVGADAVVLAHTADDQAETVLMHLLRGAGLDGLKGMLPVAPPPIPRASVPLFRPLLPIRRVTLREWLRAQGHAWREDSTNQDLRLLRNRLRHQIIPFLEKEQPHLREHLARTARALAADHEWLEMATEQAWQEVVQLQGKAVRLDRNRFLAAPRALQRRLLRRAFFYLRPTSRDLSLEQTTQGLNVAMRGGSGSRATLPGHLFLVVEGDTLWVGSEVDYSEIMQLSETIDLPDQGEIEAGGLIVRLREVGREALPEDWAKLPVTTALLDREAVRRPLRLRPPRTGDRWRPIGMDGQDVDLRDWLAKQKVPRAVRPRIPLLVDADDRILWVVGQMTGEDARVSNESKQLLEITVAHGVLQA